MNQKKLLAASVAAACLAMTTSALAADYSNHTGTADGTTLAGHLNSTSVAINSTNDTFENNKLTFTATGGLTTAAGIAASNTTVTVTDGTFTSNEVSDSTKVNGVYGTAVGVSGATDGSSTLTITNSTFTSNKGTSHNQTEGGAVYQSIGTATIKGSRFDQNSAEAAEGTAAYAMGGAVSLWGTTTDIEDSTFTNNSAVSYEGGSSLGGALYLRGGRWGGAENLSASIKNSTFEGNSAKGTNAKGGALYAKSDYVDNKHLILNLDLDNVTFKNNISDRWGGAMFVEGEGSLTMKDVTFEGNQGVYGSALVVNGNKPNETVLNNVETATVTATNVNYLNNVSKDYGATLWLYTKTQYNQTGGSFVGNKTTGSGDLLGAVFVKGAEAVFKDVLFQNNTVESSDGIAAGGAVYVDIVKNDEAGVVGGSVKFIATKDMTYSGNNVTGKDIPVNTYGFKTTTAGGFLLLDRGTSAEFEVKDGATLTIGEDGSTGNMDSIASAYPESVDQSVASIKKTGSGTLVINSDMNLYYGKVDVQAGRMEVNTTWSLREAATISGGTLALKDFNFDKMPDPLSTVGSITVKSGGTLETASAQLFKNGLGDGSVTDAGDALKADKVTVEEGGTIALNDAVYNLDYASSLGNKYTNAKYVLLGQLSDASKDDLAQQDKVTLDDVAMVGENIVLNEVKITSEDKNVQIGGTQSNDYAYREESLAVASFDLGTANKVLIDGGKTLTLTGEGTGSELLKTSGTDEVGVTVRADSTLLLGGTDYAKGGTLAGTVTVESNGTLTATGGETFTVDAIGGAGTVLVGEDKTAGKLTITQLAENFTGTIFVDPAWKDDETLNVIGNASHLEISKVDTAITGTLAAGRNSLITLGADAAEASSAFEAIASIQGLSWGEKDVTAALYLGAPIEVTGKIVVDGSLTDATSVASTYPNDATIYVANQGILIVSQSQGSSDTSMIAGTLSVADGSYIGVTNATEGTFKLADTITGTTEVVTDNPFIEGEISTADGTLTNTLNADSGLSALASLGIQSMARRADFTLSETIADRTAIDQQLHAGVNLWADVSGERYEADGLAHGAEFKADMGYAAFGGDIALGQDYTVGAAFQYGKGTLRSDVSSIRNEIDSYGFALYGAKDFGAAKVVAEASYLWTENDITASQTALNQSVDANVWSVGIRGQHAFKAGAFTFTPSVGVRYSHLETDAMTIGAVNVEKQKQDLIQVPLALRVTAGETNAAGWQLAPFFKVAYVPTFGDKEIEVLSHETDVIDTNPVQSAFGLRAQNGNLLLNADFTVGGSKDGTSSVGGKIGVKYAF
ncbi:autotransporter outer membrane beta-barrel domain-containing protein [Sutterella wadsworthensis]|mgnify:CR=1 FL=1|uniref:autotransporter outer membrane beta-barrel domain-containing protein n=1 Tax=Sutterella wadsworthensis TaxID=40545 RepID=UPI00242EAA57|nr:autotransporter outer membrane beta-barrel domain-containing protein [Sutterella wadsworthensis]